ncbi:MAG TPA: SCO family protein [Pyrinomonadaceae bacterium]|nr:SCO family protein [Pyrinomonadaceae bacterium]
MRYLSFILFSILLFAACQKSQTTPQQQNASAETKRYNLKGKVVSVDKAKKKAEIAHDDIPGFMDAMTMSFSIRADWVWEDLTPGAEIRAELVVDDANADYWLENVGIIAAPNPNQPTPPVDERFAQIGREIPDFKLTNQDGKRFSMRDYRGKALAITFIYAQCPLPDYCIKMSTNFSDVANQMRGSDMKDQLRLLSISFDPARDTPEKLKQYGQGYLGRDAPPDFTVWQLAVGADKEVREVADFFGLRYEIDPNDKTQFSHSLRTAVIAPDGKVTKIFPGSDWTANDLLREMQTTLR